MHSDTNSQAQKTNHAMRVRIKKGLDIQVSATPDMSTVDSKASTTSTLLGRDFPVTRFHVVAEEGSLVQAGEPVLCDRRRPDILFTAAVSGTVTAVRRGAKRTLISLQITCDGEGGATEFDIPSTPTGKEIRQLMLLSGLWTTLRSRPFGQIPDPGRKPKALLVTAIDTQPLAPDPAVVIARFPDEFSLGMKTISGAVDAPVYLCKSTHGTFPLDGSAHALVAEFDGPHPAGLTGTHIHALCPIGFTDDQVWYLSYQDVISLGHLMSTGRPWYDRIVSLAGPAVRKPRLITVPLGAGTEDITANELVESPARIISGSVLCGHAAVGDEACLGQRHHQVTVISEASPLQQGWWHKLLFDIGRGTAPDPLIPTTDLDCVSPPGILAVPLLRALLVGDIERARDLGALELVEEDLALLSYVCSCRIDFGPLLRDMLDQLHKESLSHG